MNSLTLFTIPLITLWVCIAIFYLALSDKHYDEFEIVESFGYLLSGIFFAIWGLYLHINEVVAYSLRGGGGPVRGDQLIFIGVSVTILAGYKSYKVIKSYILKKSNK